MIFAPMQGQPWGEWMSLAPAVLLPALERKVPRLPSKSPKYQGTFIPFLVLESATTTINATADNFLGQIHRDHCIDVLVGKLRRIRRDDTGRALHLHTLSVQRTSG